MSEKILPIQLLHNKLKTNLENARNEKIFYQSDNAEDLHPQHKIDRDLEEEFMEGEIHTLKRILKWREFNDCS